MTDKDEGIIAVMNLIIAFVLIFLFVYAPILSNIP